MRGSFVFLLLTSLLWLGLVHAQIYQCHFGNEQRKGQTLVTFIGQLPSSRNLSHSCVASTDSKHSFLRVKAKKNLGTRGSLHVSVYGADESSLLGHLGASEAEWNTLTVCPTRSTVKGQESYVAFTGTPNLSYTAEVDHDPLAIELDKAKDVTLKAGYVKVFQFIAPQDISKTQLDVTAISDSDVPAYLKVSRSCKDVLENIRIVDYKGQSLRLSFAKKGRITLSKASVPPLTDSKDSWFIGIALKNETGTTPLNTTKSVTLTLKRSFDYHYAGPLSFVILVSGFGGLLCAVWAYCCYKVPFVLTPEDSTDVTDLPTTEASLGGGTSSNETQDVEAPAQEDSANGNMSTSGERLSCLKLCQAMVKVLSRHWFKHGPKTFSYQTSIVGFVLLVGASQFVFAKWHLMIEEGDRDNCYYNDFCYRVTGFDIPFNLMISNVAYMIHGLILFFSVWLMEADLLVRCEQKLEKANRSASRSTSSVPPIASESDVMALKRGYTLTIGYGFAWALFFEGYFSSLYHLCPARLTFQFDTAFMFVITGLMAISLYNGISPRECSQKPVSVTSFFLFFIVPLYIFNCFGSLHSAHLALVPVVKTLFWVCLTSWYIIIFFWAGYKLFYEAIARRECDRKTKIKALFCFLFLIGFIVINICFHGYLPFTFLFNCVVVSVLAAVVCAFMKCCQTENRNSNCKNATVLFFQILYVIVMVVVWVAALVLFVDKATTDKVETPEKSRDKNQDCIVLGFFDYHDIWHILSSFGLLMGAHLILYISY